MEYLVLLVALIVLFVFVGIKAIIFIKSKLHGSISNISSNFFNAVKVFDEANDLLSSMNEKYNKLEKEIALILENATKNKDKIIQHIEQEIKEITEDGIKFAENKIIENKTVIEKFVREYAINVATEVFKEFINDYLEKNHGEKNKLVYIMLNELEKEIS